MHEFWKERKANKKLKWTGIILPANWTHLSIRHFYFPAFGKIQTVKKRRREGAWILGSQGRGRGNPPPTQPGHTMKRLKVTVSPEPSVPLRRN